MMHHLSFKKVLKTLGLGFILASNLAWAQYPEKSIRMIVPQAAGSATDTVARILVSELGPILGQTIVIENKPGGGFTIGLDIVAKAAPDGYTIGMGPIGAMAISPNMMSRMPYDVERDIQPVSMVTKGHLLLAVSPQLPINSVSELIAYAKKNPGKLTNASSANGSPGHVGGELFKLMSGTQILHVPYKGGAMVINDLMAGQVDMTFESLNSIAPHARAGKVKALAVSGSRRSPGFPQIPTLAESGLAGYDAPTWTGVIAPMGLPKPILEKLNAAINRAIQTPNFKEKFNTIGDEPTGGTPEDYAEVIRAELAKWRDVVKRSGAKLD